MNILNEKPQIGGVGFKDPHGVLSKVAGNTLKLVKDTGEYGIGGVSASKRILTTGLSDTSIAISSGASRAATTIGEKGKMVSTEMGKVLPHIPVSNMIKAGSKYNTFYKLIILVLFFTIFLKVIIDIFRFFGIDIIDIYSYMGWIIFLMIILFFIPHDYSTLKLN